MWRIKASADWAVYHWAYWDARLTMWGWVQPPKRWVCYYLGAYHKPKRWARRK